MAVIRMEYPNIMRRITIPPIMKDITDGGIPANHKFSGNGVRPGDWYSRTCHPLPTVAARMINAAVTVPMPLTRPETLLGKDLLSNKSTQCFPQYLYAFFVHKIVQSRCVTQLAEL